MDRFETAEDAVAMDSTNLVDLPGYSEIVRAIDERARRQP